MSSEAMGTKECQKSIKHLENTSQDSGETKVSGNKYKKNWIAAS